MDVTTNRGVKQKLRAPKKRIYLISMDNKKILQQAIDLHVHIGPEIIPRKFTLPNLLVAEKGKLKGIGVKNHFFPTRSMKGSPNNSGEPKIIYSIVLNHFVGGFNADAVRATAELSASPIIVWFPTLHAQNFLQHQQWEIPPEWIDPARRKNIRLRPANTLSPLTVLDNNDELRKDVLEVLEVVKEYNAILATGHLSWQESSALVKTAVNMGIKKIIITHPIYQPINMPVDIQRELANLGAFIEHSFSMVAIDGISVPEIAKQIKAVGADKCILTSDVGQTFSKNPSAALSEFIDMLCKEGISEEEIKRMLIQNPTSLIGQVH